MTDKPNVKKRKVESRLFHEEWTTKYLFVELCNIPICLVCKENIAVLKDYNLKRHYESRHEANYRHLTSELREQEVTKLKRELVKQQEIIRKPVLVNKSVVKASYVISQIIAQRLKPFSDGEFVKNCMVEAAEILTPDNKNLFEMISLTRKTVAPRIQDMGNNITVQLATRTAKSIFFALAFDESTDVIDTAQLSIFIRGKSSDFELFEDLLALETFHDTTKGCDIAEVIIRLYLREFLTYNGASSQVSQQMGHPL